MKKKLLSTLMAMIMVLSMFPAAALEESVDPQSSGTTATEASGQEPDTTEDGWTEVSGAEALRMIGVLKTLGMGNGALQKMFVIRSSFIILRGMVWGNLIGIGLCLLQYFTGWITLDEQGYFLTTLPVSIRWGWVLMLNAGTFVLIVALLSLPTMLISFILPERSIRFE